MLSGVGRGLSRRFGRRAPPCEQVSQPKTSQRSSMLVCTLATPKRKTGPIVACVCGADPGLAVAAARLSSPVPRAETWAQPEPEPEPAPQPLGVQRTSSQVRPHSTPVSLQLSFGAKCCKPPNRPAESNSTLNATGAGGRCLRPCRESTRRAQSRRASGRRRRWRASSAAPPRRVAGPDKRARQKIKVKWRRENRKARHFVAFALLFRMEGRGYGSAARGRGAGA